MKLSGGLTAIAAILAILAALACGAAATPTSPPVLTPTPIPPPTVASNSAPVPRSAVGNTFNEPLSSGLYVADVVDKVLPSVVQIVVGLGSGTGFIVNENGLVVTDLDVVQGASKATLRLADGSEFRARVTERHLGLDLAFLEIEATRTFTPIVMRDSNEVRLRETVIAIGFPSGQTLGLEPTVSVGGVLAKRGDGLQTDTPMNPGNIGGPLLDEFGRAVGVVVSIVDVTVSGKAVSGAFAKSTEVVKAGIEHQVSPWGKVLTTPTPLPTATLRPTRTLIPTPTPWGSGVPTARLGPTPVPTSIIPWESLFDYSELLPKTEPKPNWQIAVERWKSLEWFEQVCSTGEVFQIAGRNWKEVVGKGHLSRIDYYEEPFPKAEFTQVVHERSGFNPYPLGAIDLSDDSFETFGVTCVLTDRHVDVRFACYEASCVENSEMKILSDQLAFVLFHSGGDSLVQVQMRCLDGASECPLGGIWMVSFSPPSHSNIIEYQRQNRSN